MEIKKSFIFEQDAAKACHASTILKLPDGRLLAAWFAGTAEKNDDVRIKYAVCDGGVWSPPRELPGQENAPHWNPVLFLKKNGVVRLFFKEGKRIGSWVTKYADSRDGGQTWTEPKFLVVGDASGGRGPVKNKCLRAANGTVLAPASTEKNQDWQPFIDLSFDDGDKWTKVMIPRPCGRPQLIQPTLWEDDKNVLHCLMRSKSGRLYKSDSYDGGRKWEPARRTDIPNNNSGVDCVRTGDGRLWLVSNPTDSRERSPLTLSVSTDNGATFKDAAVLEDIPGGEFSYPAIIADGNRLYITYTYNREKIAFAEAAIDR
ncbi:MAG: exo-alpha-sialidase [Clostridia bacterium]|nr:exo-alpha-sialidase [Clostridia bacterium]